MMRQHMTLGLCTLNRKSQSLVTFFLIHFGNETNQIIQVLRIRRGQTYLQHLQSRTRQHGKSIEVRLRDADTIN